VGVDHLILATIDHPAAGELLAKEGINAAALRDRVSAGISATPSTDPQSDFLTEPTKQFQAVIEQAIGDAQVQGRDEVGVVDVLMVALHPAPRRSWWQLW